MFDFSSAAVQYRIVVVRCCIVAVLQYCSVKCIVVLQCCIVVVLHCSVLVFPVCGCVGAKLAAGQWLVLGTPQTGQLGSLEGSRLRDLKS